MKEEVFEVLRRINYENIGNSYWGIENFYAMPVNILFNTEMEFELNGKYVYIWGEARKKILRQFGDFPTEDLKITTDNDYIYMYKI